MAVGVPAGAPGTALRSPRHVARRDPALRTVSSERLAGIVCSTRRPLARPGAAPTIRAEGQPSRACATRPSSPAAGPAPPPSSGLSVPPGEGAVEQRVALRAPAPRSRCRPGRRRGRSPALSHPARRTGWPAHRWRHRSVVGATARCIAQTRPSHGWWKSGSSVSIGIAPNPCIPPRSCTPSTQPFCPAPPLAGTLRCRVEPWFGMVRAPRPERLHMDLVIQGVIQRGFDAHHCGRGAARLRTCGWGSPVPLVVGVGVMAALMIRAVARRSPLRAPLGGQARGCGRTRTSASPSAEPR